MAPSIKSMLEFITLEEGWRERRLPIQSEYLGSLREREVLRAGISELRRPAVIHRPQHTFHWLVCSTSGGVRVIRQGRTFRMRKGELWVFPSGTEYTCHPDRSGWDYFWFHLEDSQQWRHLHAWGDGEVHPGFPDRTGLAMQTILLETSVHSWHDTPQMLRSCSDVISIWIARRLEVRSDPRHNRIREELEAVWRRVGTKLDRIWRAEDIAGMVGVSVPQLHRYTGQVYGASPMEMVKRMRMARAEELLLSTDYPLKRIAAAIGYDSPFSFSKAFKKHSGSSPAEFRVKTDELPSMM